MTDTLPVGVTEEGISAYLSALSAQAGGAECRNPRLARRLAIAQLARGYAAEKPKETGATRFTTKYAIAYGEKQGWKLMDREKWNPWARGGKGAHKDAAFFSDAVFIAPGGKTIAIQGAGVGERKDHRAKFDEAKGEAKCKEFGIEFRYMEFVRGKKAPVRMETWV